MHRPVLAARQGELAGPVQRVDDPDPRSLEPDPIVLRLLGQNGVARPFGRQLTEQERVGRLVTPPAQVGGPLPLCSAPVDWGPFAGAGPANVEQQGPGRLRQPGGEDGVRVYLWTRAHRSSWAITQSAMADGLPWPGRSTSSGLSGGS